MITLTAFRSVPPSVRGLVRDLRVRWALEEAGTPYRERLVGSEDLATTAYHALQPFGQVPAIEDDGFDLVFSDIVMPGRLDGLGLAQIIRRRYPELPILLTTGYSDAVRDVHTDFPILRKPYRVDELSRALSALTPA